MRGEHGAWGCAVALWVRGSLFRHENGKVRSQSEKSTGQNACKALWSGMNTWRSSDRLRLNMTVGGKWDQACHHC